MLVIQLVMILYKEQEEREKKLLMKKDEADENDNYGIADKFFYKHDR